MVKLRLFRLYCVNSVILAKNQRIFIQKLMNKFLQNFQNYQVDSLRNVSINGGAVKYCTENIRSKNE